MAELIKLTPITKEQFEMALMTQKVNDAISAIPTPLNGRDGAQGASGRDGKDGVTTTVVKEVLASKEKLLDKEEFEKFKAQMLKMEKDIRDSLAMSHNYFPGGGGGGDLVNVIQVTEDTTITKKQLKLDKYNVILVTTAGITVILPKDDGTKIIEVKQGFVGTGTYTICRE